APRAPRSRVHRRTVRAAAHAGAVGSRTPVVPHAPRRVARIPERAEVVDVANRVGALPEAFVVVDRELAVGGELLERLALEDARRIGVEAVEHAPVEDEEAARDETTGVARLLGERIDAVAVDDELPEARRRMDARDGREAAVRTVERDQLGEVEVGDA